MKGFSIAQKCKLIITLKKADIYQLLALSDLVEKEISIRKKKESKALKNVKS